MKNIFYYIVALLVLSSTFFSCKKDNVFEDKIENQFSEITTDFNEILDLRDDDFCLEVPELCPRVGIIHTPQEDPKGPTESGSSSRIVFKDQDREYLVQAVESPEGSKSFAVVTKEQIFVMSDTRNDLYTRFADETIEIPDCIKQVFEMDYEKWSDGSLTVEDVQATYEGRPISENSEERYMVVEDSFLSGSDTDCPPQAKLITNYFWCSYRLSATTSAIQKHLMEGLPAAVVNSTKFTVREAVKKCAPPAPDCFGCIDQECILDELRATLSSSLTKRMRENYLKLYLRMNDEQFAELKNNQALFDEYLDFYGLKSPVECDGDCLHATSGAKARLEASGVEVTQEMIDQLCATHTSTNSYKYNCLRNMGIVEVDEFLATAPQADIDEMLAIPGCNKDAIKAKALFFILNQTLDLDDNKTFLEANLIHLERMQGFLKKHENPGDGDDCEENDEHISEAVANAYADVCAEVEEIDMGEIGNSDDVIWEFMKDALLASVKEAVADFIPGGTLVLMGPELFANLQSGMWMDAMFTALEIVVNEADACFPPAKVLSAGIGLAVTGKHLKKAFDAFKKAKSMGADFLTNLYKVFRVKLGWTVSNVRDRFEWLGGVNNLIKGVGGEEFFEKLKEQFGSTTPVFTGKNGFPVFKIINIPINEALFAELYPDAGSGWGFTIEITKGPKNATSNTQVASVYKFRFFG